MRSFIIAIFVALAVLVTGGCGDASAAVKRPAKCKQHNYKVHHPKKCGTAKRKAAKPAPRVATRAEYNRLDYDMTYAEVGKLFNAPRRLNEHNPAAILIHCPEGEFFCQDADGNGTGEPVAVGARNTYTWFTGYDKYDGRGCWSIYTEFYQDPDGVYRLQSWENWYNTCITRYN